MRTATKPAGPTAAQLLLVAAAGLEQPFHESDLAEAAWRADPQRFGVTGKHDKYPSDNKTRSAIVGERGLAKCGWLVKVGPYTYELSPQGRQEAERVRGGSYGARRLGRIQVPRDIEVELERLLGTTAYRAAVSGAKIPKGAGIEFFDGDPDYARLVMTDAGEYVVGGGLPLRSGRVVSEAELGRLAECDAALRKALA